MDSSPVSAATKKRKTDENGTAELSPEASRKILEPFTRDQLLEIIQSAMLNHPDVLDAVRSVADRDPTQRKLFIRGLGWETNTDKLRALFSAYGVLEEAVVILDKNTGKSKGYGFITFKHIDGALNALKEPSKQIDGRMTVTQLAAAGNQPATTGGLDTSTRKIFIGSVPFDMPADRLLAHFSQYGEIEEGPLGYDKQTGKSRGYALFVYKSPESARSALIEPNKMIDGHQLLCKLAVEGKKLKPDSEMPPTMGVSQVPGTGNPYGASGYGMPPPTGMGLGLNSPSVGATGGMSGQIPGSGYPSAYIGGATQYGSVSQYGSTMPGSMPGSGSAVGSVGGYGGMGSAASMYRTPQNSVGGVGGVGVSAGVPTVIGGYPETGAYGLSSAASVYQTQQMPPQSASPAPRVGAGGLYQSGIPPYY